MMNAGKYYSVQMKVKDWLYMYFNLMQITSIYII